MKKARARFAKTRPGIVYLGWDGRSAAVNGITIADSMFPSSHDWGRWYGPRGLEPQEGLTIMGSMQEILTEDQQARRCLRRVSIPLNGSDIPPPKKAMRRFTTPQKTTVQSPQSGRLCCVFGVHVGSHVHAILVHVAR